MCVAAVVCGHTARAAIRASGNRLPGAEVATTGLVLGYGCLGLGALLILLGVAVLVFWEWLGLLVVAPLTASLSPGARPA